MRLEIQRQSAAECLELWLVRDGGPVIELVSRWLLPMMQDWWDSSS